MNKKQIIDKIIDDLPTRDMRGEMSPDEWYGWFEEAFDKGYSEALRIHDVVGRSEQLKAFQHFAEFAKEEYGLHIPLNLMKEYVKSL